MALKKDGTVWTWGQNSYGQLGNGASDDWDAHPLPQQVPGLSGVVSIGTGQYHTLVVKNDGTVWVWGENYYGELGDGTATRRTSPIQVLGENGEGFLNDVLSVAGGCYYSLAIKNDQTVWAWGYNDYGQLGRPITSYSYNTPAQSSGLTGITHVAAGEEHSLAMDRDGNVWALGYNRYGQLGIGSSDWDKHPTPVQVGDFSVAVDTTPPSVSLTKPYQDAVGVYVNQTINISFNGSVQPGETFANILLADSAGNPVTCDTQTLGVFKVRKVCGEERTCKSRRVKLV